MKYDKVEDLPVWKDAVELVKMLYYEIHTNGLFKKDFVL